MWSFAWEAMVITNRKHHFAYYRQQPSIPCHKIYHTCQTSSLLHITSSLLHINLCDAFMISNMKNIVLRDNWIVILQWAQRSLWLSLQAAVTQHEQCNSYITKNVCSRHRVYCGYIMYDAVRLLKLRSLMHVGCGISCKLHIGVNLSWKRSWS